MIDDKYIELMHREIDGQCSERERAELEAYLKENPEANRHYEELMAVARMLGSVEELEPPPELRESIFSAVFDRTGRREEKETSVSFVEALRLTFNRKFAYAFTAGLVVGICLFALLFRAVPSRVPGDLDHLYGTLATTERQAGLFTTDPIDFSLPEVSGSLHIQHTSDAVVVTVKVSSESRVQIVFEYKDDFHFEGLRALDNRDYALRVTSNRAELTHVGSREYVAVLKGCLETQTTIGLKVLAEGSLLFEEAILLGRK